MTPPALAALLLALGALTGARAETSPYFIGASLGYGHDSNIYRLSSPIGDTFTSVGIVAGLDQPIGRGRLYASGNVRNNRYSERTELDNTSYGLNAGLDWASVERLSGNLGVAVNNNLASYGAGNTLQITKKNLEKSSQLSASVQYGLVSLLSLESVVAHREIDYSADEYAVNEVRQNSLSLGLKYRPSGALTLGTALRATRGRYPSRPADFDRNDIDFTALWVATGQSTVTARVSFGKQDNTTGGAVLNSAVNFSGVTGALGWTWQPTGKLSFNTTLSRDTGLETSFLQLPTGSESIAIGDSSRLTTAMTVTGNYAATAKIRLGVTGRYSHRDLVDTSALAGGPAITDTDIYKSLAFSASYAPTRNWLLACNAAHDVRRASGVLSTPFWVNSASCSVQFVIQ